MHDPFLLQILADDTARQIRTDIQHTNVPRGTSPPRSGISRALQRLVQALHKTQPGSAAANRPAYGKSAIPANLP